jgi:hypothetical protein
MKTIVLQSFRTRDVPDPISRCLASVESWAAAARFEYRFIDDALFACVPDWFRAKVDGDLLPMSDLARLKWAKRLLEEEAMRVIWLDADVLVFDPASFTIDVTSDYAVGREVWVRRGGRDKFLTTQGLHNAVLVFCRGNSLLDFLIQASEAIVAGATEAVLSHQIGPDLLNRFADIIGDRVVPDVGLFSPVVTTEIAKGGGRAVDEHRRAFGAPIRAANLCLSFVDRESSGVVVDEGVLNRAVDRLLDSRGAVVNQDIIERTGR